MNLKHLDLYITYRLIASLLLFLSLSCSHGYPDNVSPVAATTPASARPSPSSQEKRNIPDDFPIIPALDSGLPVSLVGLQFLREGVRKGDLQIQIKNVSEKPIKAVHYWLAPMPCRQYDMPDLIIAYGESELSGSKTINSADSILTPNQTANVLVKRKDLEDYMNPKRPSNRCSHDPDEKPRLFLAKVVFADGTAWEIGKQNSFNQ